MEMIHALGAGVCGKVVLAKEAGGREVAAKVFNPQTINRQLLEEMTLRLEEAGWPAGAMPQWSADFRGRSPLRIGPALFDGVGEGRTPSSLQHRLEAFPGDQSWPVTLAILKALASLHACQVAHANLKPGNVFFAPGGDLFLTDWAMGNVPGVQGLGFTDALLYQPPEQLRQPGGYLREKGYRWDVFAFGVLAYRLLTGTFPRCGPVFDKVAPPPGQTRREGVAADLELIAASIEAQPTVTWPDAPADALEEAYREILARCLSLDLRQRPATAGDVLALFTAAQNKVKTDRVKTAALDHGRHIQRRAWRANVAAWTLAAGLVVMAFLWQLNRSQGVTSQEAGTEKVKAMSGNLQEIQARLDASDKARQAAEQELAREKDVWLARIEASRSIGDHLFAWAMEKGNRGLPPLDGQELRLSRLEHYFQDFVTRNAEVPALRGEWALAKLQLAEVSLAKSDAVTAQKRLEDALEVFSDLPPGADTALRLATDRLLLALLLQQSERPETADAFTKARQALEHVPQAEVDADRVQELLAVLDFHESRLLAASGQDGEALERLHRSTEVLNRLALERPDVAVLRSELVMCYLASATILDGIGQMGDARTVRSMAAEELLKLISQSPLDLSLRKELAGCYGAMAQAASLAGDPPGAEAMSKASIKLLEELLKQRPDDPELRSLLAAQRSVTAGILRDRGDLVGATKAVDDGILLVEGVAVGQSGDPLSKYRLAILWWQKGKILGNAGRRKEEIDWEQKALDELKGLSDTDYGVIRAEEIKHSMGYVLGDLGHAAQLASNQPLAKTAFGDAVRIWEQLNRDRPSNEEYEECLTWSLQRLKEVR